jgi:hypothetical protein
MEDKKTEARNRLLQAIPYLRFAVEEAKKDGAVYFGILAIQADGSGNIKAKFEAEDFFKDLDIILDAPAQTEDDILNAQATTFLHRLGLK